jgi:hypothetical protein
VKFSFLGMGQESSPLQLYGKLPLAKDYLRIGCGDGSAREMREWLDRTFGTARSATEQLVLGEPLRFLGQGDKEPLQGCLWPSSDAGGLRQFPFTVFVVRRRKALLADLEAGLAEAEGVWRTLEETRERCLSIEDGRAMLDEHRGREVEVSSSANVASEPADLDSWVGALWPEQGLDGLNALFARLAELARNRHLGPYRMPLVRELPLRDQVVAWTSLLASLGALESDEIPTLFFPSPSLVPPPDPACLLVSRKALADDQVAWLTASDEALGPGDFAPGRDGNAPAPASPSAGASATKLRESLRAAWVSSGLGNGS